MDRKLIVVLVLPGGAEMPLLTELRTRDDIDILAVVDPTGASVGAALAEIMGLPVVADFASVPPVEGAVVLLPAEASAEANDLAAAAQTLGFEVLPAAGLRERLARAAVIVTRSPQPVPDLTGAEQRCAAAQVALAFLEESLALETLLPELLDLAIRAVNAQHGSLMLADETATTLHIAAARGLGEATLKQTRLPLGEGIAGRVAQTRHAELLRGASDADGHRDRPEIETAASVPLVHDDILFGVLNVSTSRDEPPLDDGDVAVLEGLAGRMASILSHALRLPPVALHDTFADAFARLRTLAAMHEPVPDLLCAWTQELAVTLDAARVTLAAACADGSLLLAESAPGEASRAWHEPLDDPAWQTVFAAGAPLVAQTTSGEGLTAVYLPLGTLPITAGLAVQLPDPSRAAVLNDHWPQLSGELSALVAEHVVRRVSDQRHARLVALCATLVDLATTEHTPGQLAEHICRAAAELTGAKRTAAVVSIGGSGVRLAGGDAPDDAPWLEALPPLVAQAGASGWRATTLEGGIPPLSILVATCGPGRATPALVLVGKERVYPLDGEGFTGDDADIAVPLAALLGALPTTGRELAPLPTTVLPVDAPPVAAPPVAAPPVAAPPMAAPPVEPAPVEPPPLKPPAVEPPPAVAGESGLVFALRREMSRCDRYHNVFGVLVARLAPNGATAGLAARLAARLRTSDRVFDLGGGEIAIIAPEDVQNLDHFERRLRDELGSLAGPAAAAAPITRTVYPGPTTSPQDFLKRARRRD